MLGFTEPRQVSLKIALVLTGTHPRLSLPDIVLYSKRPGFHILLVNTASRMRPGFRKPQSWASKGITVRRLAWGGYRKSPALRSAKKR